MIHYRLLLATAAVLSFNAFVAGADELIDLADTEKTVGQPLAQLPAHIEAPAGKLTLFADFDHAGKTVPVYLVNRTGRPVQLSSQDGSVYLKLEYRGEDTKWRRAQPHAYSWCGNSYFFRPKLADQTYTLLKGQRYEKGERATVRYRLYQSNAELAIHSNVGVGLIDPEMVKKASSDAMAVDFGDFDFVASVAAGNRKLVNEMDHIKDLRDYAIYALSQKRFDGKGNLEALRQLEATAEEPYAEAARHAVNIVLDRRARDAAPKNQADVQ